MERNKRLAIAACLVVLIGLGGPSPTDASTLRFMNLSELTLQAELIFSGRTTRVESHWNEAHTVIWTDVTFSLQEIIKGGSPGAEITLHLPGGAIAAENIRLQIDGVPEFAEGEEVLIFASLDPALKCPIIGWRQGRFTLRTGGNGVKEIVETEQARELMPAGRAALAAESAAPTVTYEDFVSETRRIMTGVKP